MSAARSTKRSSRATPKSNGGVSPTRLPAAILKRLPLRFTYDDNYFNHRFQGIPTQGYTHIVAQLLEHDRITLHLDTAAESVAAPADHTFYTGPIDRYFGYRLGRLAYRTLRFEEIRSKTDILGTAVMNFCDAEVPWTRIAEHKYFAPWSLDTCKGSIAFREYSSAAGPDDIPYYPLRLVDDKALLARYADAARKETSTTFLGRLGTYRYLDMDVTIREALDVARASIQAFAADTTPKPLYAEVV